jgi:hypothetical protein
MLFKVSYRDLCPSGDVIGRGTYVDAPSLAAAETIARQQTRSGETLDSVRCANLEPMAQVRRAIGDIVREADNGETLFIVTGYIPRYDSLTLRRYRNGGKGPMCLVDRETYATHYAYVDCMILSTPEAA